MWLYRQGFSSGSNFVLACSLSGEYGFLPQTLASDGDPMDVLVVFDTPSFSGYLMEVRPIGLLEMLDQGVKDPKVLAVARHNPRYHEVHNYTQIYPHLLGRSHIILEFTKTLKANARK
ncbi:MAG TPA: inorganic diphosphatase [Terriglobales bacterium]